LVQPFAGGYSGFQFGGVSANRVAKGHEGAGVGGGSGKEMLRKLASNVKRKGGPSSPQPISRPGGTALS